MRIRLTLAVMAILAPFNMQAMAASAATAQNVDTSVAPIEKKRSVPEFEIIVDKEFARPTTWQELIGKIQAQDRKSRLAKGGVDAGGGSSVIDPKTGKRRLLDLAEEETWTYVDYIPVSANYLKNLWPALAKDLELKFFNSLSYFWTNGQLNWKENLLMGFAGAALVDVNSRSGADGLHFYKDLLVEIGRSDIKSVLEKRIDETGRVVRWVFVDFPLSELNDEGYIRLVDPSTKRQVAVQKDGVVIIHRAEYDLLDDESKGALFLHEGVLSSLLVLKPEIIAGNGTAPVRKIVRRVLAYELMFSKFEHDRSSVDPATLTNYHQAIEEAVQELVNLGF